MTGASRGSRVVFVGNIPYDMSEEQLIDIFREVGTVVGFRLVFDRETGKPKGYGFCEFEDAETAASAVRNLNDKDVGGRPMRIDFADVDPMFEGRTTSMGQVEANEDAMHGRGGPPPRRGMRGGAGGPGGMGAGPARPQLPPNLPQGQPLQPGVGATDAISQTLAALPPNQLLDILGQMKGLVSMAPDQAKALLNGHPQLAYALFQAMLMMNVVDAEILQRILTNSGALGSDAGAPPAGRAPLQPMGYGPGPGGPPMQGPPMGGYAGGPPPMYDGPPPPMMGPGPPMQPSMSAGGPPPVAHLPDDQRALLEQVMQLTPEQINALPPDQREGIMQLKASLGHA